MNTAFLGLELQSILPEIILAVLAMVLLLMAASRGDNHAPLLTRIALGGMVLAVLATSLAVPVPLIGETAAAEATSFNGHYAVDRMAGLLKVLVLLGSALSLLLAVSFLRSETIERSEFPVLMVLSTLGMCVMVSANNLLLLYIGIELLSLPLYVLATIRRDDRAGSEAGLKYFVLGALSSGLLLYGVSLIYGFSGTLDFTAIGDQLREAPASGGARLGMIAGLVFVIAGLAFKVSAVPFHMWTPDVYQGAPMAVTAFFAASPKLAGMALFLRLMAEGFAPAVEDWKPLIALVAGGSMLVGSLFAVAQTSFKRLMAYSSIGHVGFALMGLAAGSQAGVQGVIVYLAIYLFMTLGAFAVIMTMRRDGRIVENIAEFRGLIHTHRPVAMAMTALLFSMAGIPPLAGFFAKVYVLNAAIEAELYTLSVVFAVSSTVAAYYYLRIIRMMVFDPAPEAPLDQEIPGDAWSVVTASALLVVLFVLYPSPITDGAAIAASNLFAGG